MLHSLFAFIQEMLRFDSLSGVCSRKRLITIVILVLMTSFIWYIAHFSSPAAEATTQSHCVCPPTPLITEVTCPTYNTIPDDSRAVQQFPQAIIIGVRKGGTRALIDMLKAHPDVAAALGEIHYFDFEENFDRGVQWYINRMPYTTPGQITIEKSPSYFIVKEVPLRMYMVSRNLKLILIVRDPLERAISDFTQIVAKKEKKRKQQLTFEGQAIHFDGTVDTSYPPISVSMYNVHMKRWLKYFRMEQIHIVNGDVLITDPVVELKKVEAFLGVKSFFYQDMFFYNATKGFYCWKVLNKKGRELSNCLGSGKGREHPTVSEDIMAKLRIFFEPHNEEFYTLVGHNFRW